MSTINIDQIVEKVNELKTENAEKDEVIREQQGQIEDLERQIEEMRGKNTEMENDMTQLREHVAATEEMLEKLNTALGD